MGKKLDYKNLKTEYPDLGKCKARKRLFLTSLLQDDYGEDYDCTITSLSCVFGESYYSDFERIAKKYGYDGVKRGTNPLTVKKITSDFLREKHMGGTAKSAYGKSLGWSFSMIKSKINSGIPVLLNLWDDGRGYYHDHTVTVIGYEEYQRGLFLLTFDNWNRGVTMIDYKKLCTVSSINWVDGIKR